MAGDIQVVVPDSLERITTYVLAEQQDWFEDELRAVRGLLQPGDSVIDIGANLGVYALSMARVVGDSGEVTAFEPASQTAALLRQSARLNGFQQLTVLQQGVAASSGEACLATGDDSELNQLISEEPAGGSRETVALTSLDDWLETRKSRAAISFLKIDAEGQELNILRGARRFLQEQEPLILFEIKHGAALHLELVEAFAAHGYRSYRLLPGPQLLVPFDPSQPIDGFLLNLFGCKATTARRLALQGRLVEDAAAGSPQASSRPLKGSEEHSWPSALASCPYARLFQDRWLAREKDDPPSAAATREALALYALSTDPRQSASDRAEALRQAGGW